MRQLTIVGGGLAGLVAAIASAEAGAGVHLYEAHQSLGGRARPSGPPYIAHDDPHVLYDNGPLWDWLTERDLVSRVVDALLFSGRVPGPVTRMCTATNMKRISNSGH